MSLRGDRFQDASPAPSGPGELSMVDLLHVACAVPLLDRLALLVTMRRGGERRDVVFGILAELQEHLDATRTGDGACDLRSSGHTIREWFLERIEEEGIPAGHEEPGP